MFGRIGPFAGAMLASLALLCASGSVASATASTGFYVAGEKSAEEAKQPKFTAESYPTNIEGGASTNYKFTVNLGSVECGTALYFGKITSATPAMVFQPSLFSCIAKSGESSFPVSIHANGCEYGLRVLNAGPPYTGTFGFECPSEFGYEFIVSISETLKCSIDFFPQKGVEGVSYQNSGEGSKRAVTATLGLSGLKYKQEGSKFFCKPGEYSNGTLTGSEKLVGV